MKKIAALVLFLCIWQLLAVKLSNNIFPPLTAVLNSMLIHSADILKHCRYSIYRLFMGVLLAFVTGLPIGIILAYYKKAGEFFSPVIYVLTAVPKVALLPLIMLSFGLGNASKIFIIFLIVLFQIVVTAYDAVKGIPEEHFIYYKSIKASDLFIIKNILFRTVLSDAFTALRIALATSISVLFFAETFGTRYGLGFYIMDMWMRFDYVQMYGGIFMLGVIGLVSLLLVNLLENIICPWRKFESI